MTRVYTGRDKVTGWVYPTVVVLSDFDVLDNAVVPWKHVNNNIDGECDELTNSHVAVSAARRE